MLHRSVAIIAIGAFLPVAALAVPKPAANDAKIEARLTALEKQNAELRDQVAKLQKLLTQTRMDIATGSSGSPALPSTYFAPPTVQPQDAQVRRDQTQAQIQQQNLSTQLNNLQLQQNMAQDRAREQQVFQPPAFAPPPFPPALGR